MKHRILSIVLAALFLTGPPKAVSAPPLINYQGRVAVGTPAVNFEGTGQFKFALVNATGGVTFWSNDGSSVGGSQPAASVPLTVTKGLYSVLLGDTPLMNPLIGPALFSQPDLRLRVWFSNNTPTGFQLLTPDQRLAPAAYLADGVVSSTNIAPGAVNSANIAPYAIRAEHFFPGSLDFSILQVRSPGPAPGQVLSFDGGSMVWTAPGGGVFALNGTNGYYNGGNVGIGTANPSWPLDVNGSMHVGSYSANGTPKLIRFGDGDYVSIGENNQDDRMELTAAKFVFNNGNVGIGTATPEVKLVLADSGVAQLGFSPTYGIRSGYLGGSGAELEGGDLQMQGGWTIYSGGRIRLGGSARGDADRNVVQFFQNNSERMRINDGGNVGIGTASPTAKLHVAATGAGNAVSGVADGGSGAAGISISGTGVFAFSASGNAIHAEGNVRQAREKGGFVKAIIFIHGQTIVRGFNSFLTGAAANTVPCGFTASASIAFDNSFANYEIDFGFKVDDRFVNVFAPSQSVTGILYGQGRQGVVNQNKLLISTDGPTDLTVFVY